MPRMASHREDFTSNYYHSYYCCLTLKSSKKMKLFFIPLPISAWMACVQLYTKKCERKEEIPESIGWNKECGMAITKTKC